MLCFRVISLTDLFLGLVSQQPSQPGPRPKPAEGPEQGSLLEQAVQEPARGGLGGGGGHDEAEGGGEEERCEVGG